MENKNISVGLIVGGASPEREVSKLSGAGVFNALNKLNYKVKIIDPALGLNQHSNNEDYFIEKDTLSISFENYLKTINSSLFDGIDTVFIALHGSWGEDGTMQSLLEFRGIHYTGSGILASAVSMDKAITKSILKHNGVSTPNWLTIEKKNFSLIELLNQVEEQFKFPIVIKPNDQGSAIGLSICKEVSEFEKACMSAFQYSDKILIEEYIDGHEVTVGILNDECFPVLEIKPKHDYYDYECKYTKGMSEYEVPAKLDEDVTKKIQEEALKAYKSINCKNYGRIDFRLNNKLESFCLEINTLPGLTSTSLLPKAAKAVGISFEELIDRIIKNSFE